MLRRSIINLALATLPLGLCLSLFAQGTFQDLDFEEANPVSIGGPYNPAAYVTPASAFPGWQSLIGGNPASYVVLDGQSIGGAQIELWNNNPSIGTVPI
jgi:hypothetical protein